MTTTTDHRVEKQDDLNDLRTLTAGIIGELCWGAHISYAEILVVDMGERFSETYNTKRGEYHSEMGSWYIRCLISTWKLVSPTETIVTSEDSREETRKGVKAIEDSHVTAFDPQYPDLGLIVSFSNGNKLVIIPGLDDDKEDEAEIPDDDVIEDVELPYWELKMPHAYITVGPGNVWVHKNYDDK